MSKAKAPLVPGVNPTLPKVPITLADGQTYFLCFTYRALAIAEAAIKKTDSDFNILSSLGKFDANNTAALLYAGLVTYKPELTLEAVYDLIPLDDMYSIPEKLVEAYKLSSRSTEDAKADPTQPE
jgi:hypothetical protein